MPWMDSGYAPEAQGAPETLVSYQGLSPKPAGGLTLRGLAERAMVSARVRLTRNIKLGAMRSQLTEPVVSFTFDDFPRSALLEGGRILRHAGWTGTYYAAGSFCGRRVDGLEYFTPADLLRVDQEGHEIGCHTFGHLNLRTARSRTIIEDLERNKAFVREILPKLRFASFAYPFGDLDLSAKALLVRQFSTCRGIWGGLNKGWIDRAQLSSVALERRELDESQIEAWLDQASAANAWLVFFTHDVSDNPSPYGCPTDTFARIVASVARRRIKVLPVKDAAALAAAPVETG
jgi:peptidoglycan/xylan/chitin deacetylase (PgdA/CDA1 family)